MRKGSEKKVRKELVKDLVLEKRKKMPRLGTRKLYYLLKKDFEEKKLKLGRDKLFEVLRENNLLVRKRKRYAVTTNSRHWLKKHVNLYKEIEVSRSNQVWVSDITYIRAEGGFNYLSLITDAYSRKIVGYSLSKSLDNKGPLGALRMALRQRKSQEHPLVHHSDRGIQYCSSDYTNLLTKHGVKISMGEVGNPYENAIAERANGILKEEFEIGEGFKNYQEAAKHIKESIIIYNQLRPHGSCDFMTPDEAHYVQGVLKKRWKSYPRSKTQEYL